MNTQELLETIYQIDHQLSLLRDTQYARLNDICTRLKDDCKTHLIDVANSDDAEILVQKMRGMTQQTKRFNVTHFSDYNQLVQQVQSFLNN